VILAIMTSGDADERVCLRRFGLNFDPPSIVLEYERPSSGRLFHRRIGLRRLGSTADPSRTAEKIRRQNKALLAEDQVPFEQLVSVVARLQARQCEKAEKGATAAVATPTSPAAAVAAAAVADATSAGSPSSKGPSAPASPTSAPDEQASVGATTSPPLGEKAATATAGGEDAPPTPASSASSAASSAASASKDEEEGGRAAEVAATAADDDDDSGAEASSPPATTATASAAAEAPKAALPVVDEADLEDLPDVDGDLNLNLLSTEELDKYKSRMDVDFTKTQVKPGDASFQYDVRVDHVIDEDADSCGWDDSDED